MTKREKNLSQLDLIECPPAFSLERRISEAFAADLKHSTKSRPTIASELSDILGFRVTVRNLENWAAESHQGHRVPLSVAAVIGQVTGNSNTLALASEAANGRFITGKDITYLTLVKKQLARQRLDKEIQELEDSLR